MSIEANREAMIEKAKNLPSNIVAIEGWWDGDSGGWYACLSAIEKISKIKAVRFFVESIYSQVKLARMGRKLPFKIPENRQFKRHDIGYIGHGMGEYHDFMRSLAGETPPYPEGLLAKEIGQEIAEMLGVPLYFPSPEKPSGREVPEWVDWNAGRTSSIPIHLIDDLDCENALERFESANVAVVEAYWDRGYGIWHPRIAVVIIQNPASNPLNYISHEIGELYWDDQEMGRIIFGKQIPRRTCVEEVKRLGNVLARAFGTTFYFKSPDDPQHISRWVDIQKDSRDDP